MRLIFKIFVILYFLTTYVYSIELNINKLDDLKKIGDSLKKKVEESNSVEEAKQEETTEAKQEETTEAKQEEEKIVDVNFDLKFCGYKAINNGVEMLSPQNVKDESFKSSLPEILNFKSHQINFYRGPFTEIDYINTRTLENNKILVTKYYNDSIISENEYDFTSNESKIISIFLSENEKISEEKYEYSTNQSKRTIQEIINIDLNKNIFFDTFIVTGTTTTINNNDGSIKSKNKTGPNKSNYTYLKCASNEDEIKIAQSYFDKLSNVRQAKKEKEKNDEEFRQDAIKKQKELEEYFETPEGNLVAGYISYIMLKKFYDSRKGYEVVYINDQQMNDIKNKIKEIQEVLTSKTNINTDSAWQKANDFYKSNTMISSLIDAVENSGSISNDAMSIAKSTLVEFNNLYKNLTQSDGIKKDF